MELRQYIHILRANIGIILLVTLVGGIAALVVSTNIVEKHEALMLVQVEKIPEQPESGDFTYDGYYAQQVAEGFTDTVVGLFESSAMSHRALDLTGMPTEIRDVRSLHSKTSVDKVAPQLIEVSVTDQDSEYAVVTVQALFDAVDEKVTTTDDDTFAALEIQRIGDDPLVMLRKPVLWLNMAVGLMVGLVVGVFFVAIKEYMKENTTNT